MKVSFITPSFNQAQFIERTLLSVLSQDWPSFEYVVFDGGSSDGTVDVLQKYSDRIRWVSQKDKGQADAVNKGIAATSGEIIGWINSDDVYYPGAARTVAEYFAAHPDIDIVYGMADHIDVNDRPFESYRTEPWSFERLQWHCFICQPAAFFRRTVVERYGALDPKLMYCMDYEYWLRLGAAGVRFGYLEKRLAGSRMYPENKTNAARLHVHTEINDMFRERFGFVPERWITNYAHFVARSHIKRQDAHIRLKALALLQYALADLRWNRRLYGTMLRTYSLLQQRGTERLRRVIRRFASLFWRRTGRTQPNLALFREADTLIERHGIRLQGVFKDGWASPTLHLSYPAGNSNRSLNIAVCAPESLLHAKFNLVAYGSNGIIMAEYPFLRGETVEVHVPLTEAAETIKIVVEPPFLLVEAEHADDPSKERMVTVQLKHMEIRDPIVTAVVVMANV